MQRPPPLNIGPIFIGAQPKPIDTIHIKRPPNDFSMNPHDRGLSIVRQPYLSQRYDANKHFNAIVRADLVTTAELLKPIIAAEHQATIQMLPQALDIEIKNIVQSYGTSSALNSIEIKRHEKQAIDFLISKKTTDHHIVINQANAYYGSDPLSKTMHDLLATIERSNQRPSHVFQAWSASYAAGYSVAVV